MNIRRLAYTVLASSVFAVCAGQVPRDNDGASRNSAVSDFAGFAMINTRALAEENTHGDEHASRRECAR